MFPRPSLPAGREAFPRPSLPAGRDFGPVRTYGAFPPAAARQAPPVHEATGGYAVRSPCPSGIPRPRHNASLPWAAGIAPVLAFWLHRFASLGLKSRIDARFCQRSAPRLHRFASLGLKSRIDARIALVLAFWLHRFASLGLNSRIDARFALVLASWLHRFASLGFKSRIDARFALVLASWLHRFASLGLKLRIDARICQRSAPRLQRFASLGLKSRIDVAPSCQQVEWPACSRRCRYGAASDSNFRRRKVEQFHLQ